MAESAKLDGISPYYCIVAASGLHLQDARRNIHKTSMLETSVVELNSNIIATLGTKEGFELYREAFKNFYDSESYSNNGKHSSVSIIDLASGLSLPVLARLGAIEAIDNVPVGTAEFQQAFQQAFHMAAVGISPEILRRIHRNPKDTAYEWEWSRKVTANALGI